MSLAYKNDPRSGVEMGDAGKASAAKGKPASCSRSTTTLRGGGKTFDPTYSGKAGHLLSEQLGPPTGRRARCGRNGR